MMRSYEPLERVTINLYMADMAWFRREYGRGFSERIRDLVHDHVRKRRTVVKVTEPFLTEDFDE